MPNVFATSNLVIKYITMHLWNHLTLAKLVHRSIGEQFVGSYETGGTVTIQKPLEFRPQTGAVISSIPSMFRRKFTMSCLTRKVVPFQFTTQELTVDFFKSRTQKEVIEPAMQALANEIDMQIALIYYKICNQVGAPGTTPNTTKTIRQAAERLTQFGVSYDDRHLVMYPGMVTEISESLKTLLLPEVVKPSVEDTAVKGKLQTQLAGFDCYESNNLPTHITGTGVASNILKDGASQNEDVTIAVKGLTAGQTLKAGDLITVADSYAVNPHGGGSYPFLRQMSVMADATADGSGKIAALQVMPGTSPYNLRGPTSAADKLPYQNVSALPGDNKAIACAGNPSTGYPLALAFHRDAIALATVPLEMPSTAVFKARQDWNGLSLRITGAYDTMNDQEIYRVDVLFGVEILEPLAACRIIG